MVALYTYNGTEGGIVDWCKTQPGDCEPCLRENGFDTQYYALEAGGKQLARYEVYQECKNIAGGGIPQPTNFKEWYIYGSAADGRIATVTPRSGEIGIIIDGSFTEQQRTTASQTTLALSSSTVTGTYRETKRYPGNREYEIKDHLGNVRAVISDEKTINSLGMAYPNLSYFAEVRNLNSYYAYGKDIPQGSYSSSSSYSYGFNGKERESHKDGQYDFGARIMNTDFPMFLSRDPLEYNFPFQSPYAYAANNPILLIDKDGEAAFFSQLDIRGSSPIIGSAGITGSYAVGIMGDLEGNIGVYKTWGAGIQVGGGVNGGFSWGSYPRANTISETEGPGFSIGFFSATPITSVSAEGNFAPSWDIEKYRIGFTTGAFLLSRGFGVSGYSEYNDTKFIFKANLADDNQTLLGAFKESLKEHFGIDPSEMGLSDENLLNQISQMRQRIEDEKTVIEQAKEDFNSEMEMNSEMSTPSSTGDIGPSSSDNEESQEEGSSESEEKGG